MPALLNTSVPRVPGLGTDPAIRARRWRRTVLALPLVMAGALSACGGGDSTQAAADTEHRPADHAVQVRDDKDSTLPDPCTFLAMPTLEEYFHVPVDAGYDPGFTGGLLTGEERSCSWDTSDLFDSGSLTVALYTKKDHVPRSSYPAARTHDLAIDGTSDAYSVNETPYRIFFVKGGVSVQALYQPDTTESDPDDVAEMARFTSLVDREIATRL